MTIEEIRKNEPHGATHCDSEGVYWRIDGVIKKHGWYGWVEDKFPPHWIKMIPLQDLL